MAKERTAAVDSDSLAHGLGTLKKRFHAWWEGEEFEAPPSECSGEASPDAAASNEPKWSDSRIAVAEGLWGKGFSTPGEEQHVLELVKPLALHNKLSVLDVCAGLGGSTRTIVSGTKAWVKGLEVNPELARAAMHRSKIAGLGRKAPIRVFTPPDLQTRERSIDAIFFKDALHLIEDKDAMFESFIQTLKPQGQLLMTDYLLAGDDSSSKALDDWIAQMPETPTLWSVDRTVERLQAMGFTVRIAADISDTVTAIIMSGWQNFARLLKPGELEGEDAVAVVTEVERWSRLLAAFNSGALCSYRILALSNVSNVRR